MPRPLARRLLALLAVVTLLAAPSVIAASPAAAAGTERHVAIHGSDAAAGTATSPWRTLRRALPALRAGDTLVVHGGEYQERINDISISAGTATAPVRVVAAQGERPVVRGLLWLRSPSHWHLRGINVTWDPASASNEHMVKLSGGTGWRFSGAEVWGARSYAAILVAGDASAWRLDHLWVHDTATTNSTNQDHLIYVSATAGGGTIERSVLVGSPNGRGVKIGASSSGTTPVGAVEVRYSTFVDNLGPSNIQLSYGASHNRIHRNVFVRAGSRSEAVTAYYLNGAGNEVWDNIAWQADAVVEPDPYLRDAGGNRMLDPKLVDPASGDVRPLEADAAAYGALAPGDPEPGLLPLPGSSGTSDPAPTSPTPTSPTSPSSPTAPSAPAQGGGYRVVGADGSMAAFGGAAAFGDLRGRRLVRPIVAAASTPGGAGTWLVASDGGVFSFGDARFLGSTGGTKLNRPIVAAMATPSGAGYWLVASDGGVFSFGDARFLGSTGGTKLNRPIVAAMATPSGAGYWLIASDGGVFSFGDARFHGSTGAIKLNRPIVASAPTPSGAGYWLVASDGGVFSFGDARFHGSTGGVPLIAPITSVLATPDGAGYRFVAADGGVFSFGAAAFAGSAVGLLGGEAVALAR